MQRRWVPSLGQEGPLEEGVATHSSIHAWRSLWAEESGRLQSTGSQGVRHDLVTEHACTPHTVLGTQQDSKRLRSLRRSGQYPCATSLEGQQLAEAPWVGVVCLPLRDAAAAAKSLQLCPTPCNPIDGSPPGSPIPGILQARTLEWVAISFSNESEK